MGASVAGVLTSLVAWEGALVVGLAVVAAEVGIEVVGDTVITIAVVGFEVGAGTVVAVGARVVGTLVVVASSSSTTGRTPGMSAAKSGKVKFPASWASAMQKSQSTLVMVVPSSTQHSPTMSHMSGSAGTTVANKANWSHAFSMS